MRRAAQVWSFRRDITHRQGELSRKGLIASRANVTRTGDRRTPSAHRVTLLSSNLRPALLDQDCLIGLDCYGLRDLVLTVDWHDLDLISPGIQQ